jgi:hypothetical protein
MQCTALHCTARQPKPAVPQRGILVGGWLHVERLCAKADLRAHAIDERWPEYARHEHHGHSDLKQGAVPVYARCRMEPLKPRCGYAGIVRLSFGRQRMNASLLRKNAQFG